jgi:hypothetical protein
MSKFRARRAFAGFVLVALLVSAPARAGGLSEPAFQLQDLWSHAWSWVTHLWTTQPRDVSAPGTLTKEQPPGPPSPPADPPPPRPRGTQGDQGPGIDPDG